MPRANITIEHVLVSTLLFAGACTDAGANDGSDTGTTSDSTDTTGGSDGREYYDGEPSAMLGAAGNMARCSNCHSDDGSLTPLSGESMQDIAYKTSYKGGGAPDLLSAANACITGWMGGVALTDSDPEWAALEGFLQSISDPSSTDPNPLEPEVLADQAAYEAAYAGGDATAGADKYTQFCGECHDAGLQVGSVAAYPKAMLATYEIGRIAQKVRTSGPPPSGTNDAMDTTPGPMPFFEPEELPAGDLADIIAHIKG